MEQNPPKATYSVEDYKKDRDDKAAVWFLNDADFRSRIVEQAMWDILKRWGAFIGIVNLAALVGIYFVVTKSAQQAVAAEAQKVVKERTEFVDQSVKTITSTAVTKVAEMQGELTTAQKALAKSNQQVAETIKQADDVRAQARTLQIKLQEVDVAHRALAANATFLNNPANVQRAGEFMRLVSENKNATAIGDLAYQVRELSANFSTLAWWVYKPEENNTDLEAAMDTMRKLKAAADGTRQIIESFQSSQRMAKENQRHWEQVEKDRLKEEEAEKVRKQKGNAK